MTNVLVTSRLTLVNVAFVAFVGMISETVLVTDTNSPATISCHNKRLSNQVGAELL